MKKAEQSYFLVSQDDIYKIDELIGSLNLAISEILEGRPVRDPSEASTSAQEEYDTQISPYLYPDQDDDSRQTQFEF